MLPITLSVLTGAIRLNMTIIQLQNCRKVTRTTLAQCKCSTGSQAHSLQDGKNSNGPYTFVLREHLRPAVFSLNFARPLCLHTPRKQLCLRSKVYNFWHIEMTNISPGWHVNTHKRSCSLTASSENICILQTRHLARLTCVYTVQNGFTMLRCSPWKTSKENWSPWNMSSGFFEILSVSLGVSCREGRRVLTAWLPPKRSAFKECARQTWLTPTAELFFFTL